MHTFRLSAMLFYQKIPALSIVLYVYTTVSLPPSLPPSLTHTQVDSKLGVGLVGVLLVLIAVTSSLGMYSYFGIESSLIILEVVPFLVLAVGVDNLFILVHSYEVCVCVCVFCYNVVY